MASRQSLISRKFSDYDQAFRGAVCEDVAIQKLVDVDRVRAGMLEGRAAAVSFELQCPHQQGLGHRQALPVVAVDWVYQFAPRLLLVSRASRLNQDSPFGLAAPSSRTAALADAGTAAHGCIRPGVRCDRSHSPPNLKSSTSARVLAG